jgi:hypothetical protein
MFIHIAFRNDLEIFYKSGFLGATMPLMMEAMIQQAAATPELAEGIVEAVV